MRTHTIHRSLAAVLVLTALTAVPALAATRTVALEAVSALPITGTAQLTETRSYDVLEVRATARVANGTRYLVKATIDGQQFPIGYIQMRLGSGLLTLDSRQTVSPVFPLSDVEQISVWTRSQEVLVGRIP